MARKLPQIEDHHFTHIGYDGRDFVYTRETLGKCTIHDAVKFARSKFEPVGYRWIPRWQSGAGGYLSHPDGDVVEISPGEA